MGKYIPAAVSCVPHCKNKCRATHVEQSLQTVLQTKAKKGRLENRMSAKSLKTNGAPDRIRTCGLRIRSPHVKI